MKSKKPLNVAIIGCVHGNEPIGSLAIETLSKTITPIRGTISYILAHPQAMKYNRRFIKKDLNRAFPGNVSGALEERLAHQLKKVLKEFDVVIDIHATNSNFDRLIIITKQSTVIKKLLVATPIDKVMIASQKTFGGHELINHVNAGIALEYGPTKRGDNYALAVEDIKKILANLGMIKGRKRLYPTKTCFKITHQYRVPPGFRAASDLRDFQLITKDQIIGVAKGKKVRAKENFYPIFLGKGRYKGSLALAGKKTHLPL